LPVGAEIVQALYWLSNGKMPLDMADEVVEEICFSRVNWESSIA
jgi:hypothetical protein